VEFRTDGRGCDTESTPARTVPKFVGVSQRAATVSGKSGNPDAAGNSKMFGEASQETKIRGMGRSLAIVLSGQLYIFPPALLSIAFDNELQFQSV